VFWEGKINNMSNDWSNGKRLDQVGRGSERERRGVREESEESKKERTKYK
jgi:hypothetical protein